MATMTVRVRQRRSAARRLFVAALTIPLAVLGVLAAVGHFATEPYNPGFDAHPVITKLHVVLGGIYLALGTVQFSGRVRRRALPYHRWAGRLLVTLGVLVGTSALFLGLVVPYGGNPERVVIALFGGFFLAALATGFVRVRQGRIVLHREWMMRAFAIGLSIATMRLIFLPVVVIIGDPTLDQIMFWSVTAFTVAFASHLAVVELIIRADRRRSAVQGS